MELSLICPVAHIKHTSLLAGRFCVAPIALKHTEYKKYFTNASIDHYNVILDNGVFESNKVSDIHYINLAKSIKPRVLIAPDTINAGAQANLDAALEFAELVQTEKLNDTLYKPVELMYVIQCQQNDDVGFWKVLNDVLFGKTFQWIGICRDAIYNAFGQYTHSTDQELNRFYFAARLQENITRDAILHKKWHFLGIGARLDLLHHYWFVDAMDTASLFYQATLGNMVSGDYILAGNLKRPKDYFIRDFSPEAEWIGELQFNCTAALEMAQWADRTRRDQLGGRL